MAGCFETVIDYEFVNSVHILAQAADSIADSLRKMNAAKQISDEQVKEIIKSYPKEDLYELLSYDQKRYIRDAEQKESISLDARGALTDNYSTRVEQCSDEDLDAVANDVAYLWVECCKYDSNLDYWENINNLIERALERKGY